MPADPTTPRDIAVRAACDNQTIVGERCTYPDCSCSNLPSDVIAAVEALQRAGHLNEWRPIETLVADGRMVAYLSPVGPSVGPAVEQKPLTAQERADIVRQFGTWPDQKYVVSHYTELPKPPGDSTT